MKRYPSRISPPLSSWTLLLVTSSSAVQLSNFSETVEFEGETLTHWSVLKFHQTHTHSTLTSKVHSTDDVDRFNKNTVSNKLTQPLLRFFLISVSLLQCTKEEVRMLIPTLFIILMELHPKLSMIMVCPVVSFNCGSSKEADCCCYIFWFWKTFQKWHFFSECLHTPIRRLCSRSYSYLRAMSNTHWVLNGYLVAYALTVIPESAKSRFEWYHES